METATTEPGADQRAPEQEDEHYNDADRAADQEAGLGGDDGGAGVPDSPPPPTPEPEPDPSAPDPDDDGEGGELDAAEAGEAEALSLEGDYQLSLSIGGVKPTSSVLKLRGGKIEVPQTMFKKGERLRVALDLRIGEVKIADKIDSSGDVKSTARTQYARIEGCTRLEDPQDAAA